MSKIDGKEENHAAHMAEEDLIPFPDEIKYLSQVNEKLNQAFNEAVKKVNRTDQEYQDSKRYMAQYRGELDPHEMFQNEMALKQLDTTGVFAVSVREKLEKMKDSPYFARIDFKEVGEEKALSQYIGPFAFHFENELLIADWRSPIAGMFYDYEIGPAGYDAPVGRIEGELTLKRQFKIKNGKMAYALESGLHIQDDILQKELSHTSDEKMKSIIGTIQKEQNQIIRNEKSQTLLIQGVAGSGKTSIALHRIAFLLYLHKEKLKAENVTILSPNKVFGDYISNVLPELGEEQILETGFTFIAAEALEGIIFFEPDKDPLETADEKWAKRVQYKSTLAFVKELDRYIQEMPLRIFQVTDYSFDQFTVEASWILERFIAYEKHAVKKRLQMVAEDIHSRLERDNFMGEELPKVQSILKKINGMVQVKSTLALYKDFYNYINKPQMFVMADKKTLEWADVFPFIYLQAAFVGIKKEVHIKHLIIDEMQDYTPIEYAVINLLYPCPKTILGDFGQLINPNHLQKLQDVKSLYNDATLVELNKSYRSTYEIITFARTIQDSAKIEPIKRHGEVPELISCKNKKEEIEKIKAEINSFLIRDSASLGIVMKTNTSAKELYDLLKSEYDIHLISPNSTEFFNGVSVTSVQMAKGLEFDEVIIPDTDDKTYVNEFDRSLLYIACTRAMHRLTLFYTDRQSRLLKDA